MPNIIYRWTHLHKDRMSSCNTSSLSCSNNCWDDNIQDVSNSCNTDTSQRSLFRMRIISYSNWIKVYVSMETVVLHRWGGGGVVIKRWFGFINWIKNEIGYRMFQASVFRQSEYEGLSLKTLAFETLYGGQFTLTTWLIKPSHCNLSPSFAISAEHI